jgi:hypothetical protein
MVRTARLTTNTFRILCPHCGAAQPGEGGRLDRTPEEAGPGQLLVCSAEACKKEFRMPKTLKVGAEGFAVVNQREDEEEAAESDK